MMGPTRVLWPGTVATLLSLALSACDSTGKSTTASVVQPPMTSDADDLNMTIVSASVGSDRRVTVEFFLRNRQGQPLSLADLDGDPYFVLAWIGTEPLTGYSRYQSYVVASVEGKDFEFGGTTVPPTLNSAEQATADVGGTFVELEEGFYLYIFGTVLPPTFERHATHTVGAYLSRQNGAEVENQIFHFVPSGEEAIRQREVTLTRSCNECHGKLLAHGGTRYEVGLCVLCHTDQTVDPESGESLQFGPMVHEIHRGTDLVTPFLVVGSGQVVHDYSKVRYPQDLRNCEKCHDESEEGARQADHWRTVVTRATCAGCHDGANFDTGEGHGDIPQSDDAFCWICHRPDLVVEFDKSVPGAHVLPYRSSYNPELQLAITGVSNLVPGGQPAVRFTVENGTGQVDISLLNRVAISFAGPTSDYSQLLSDGRFDVQGGNAIGTLVTHAVGDYTFVPDGYVIPTDASDTWSVGLAARTEEIQIGTRSLRFGANNPVVHIDVTSGELGGGTPEPRRKVVELEKCNDCHEGLRVHGELATETEYCVLCHNTWATDEGARPGVDPVTNPPESIDFELMIHRIHRGEDLQNGYTLFGDGGIPHDYTEVGYPGYLTDCSACHVDDSEVLPLPEGTVATVKNVAGVVVPQPDAILTPSVAACIGCHDSDLAFDHAQGMVIINSSSDWEENCSVCHRAGAGADASVRHAQR